MTSQQEPAPESTRLTTRQRRRARSLAFQTLYEVDMSGHRPADVLQRLAGELHIDFSVVASARDLVAGVGRHLADIDHRIARFAPAWPLSQMSAVDRTVLRLGIFEVIHNSTTIPVGVAINEAVELAKLYGSDNSARFVNGVLGRVASEASEELLSVERSVGGPGAHAAPE